MALNVNIIGKDSEGNLQALKVNSEGNLEISDSLGWGDLLQDISDKLDILVGKLSGTIATLYSMNFADRPLYTEITEPTVFVLMNSTMDMWWTDGSADWVVI